MAKQAPRRPEAIQQPPAAAAPPPRAADSPPEPPAEAAPPPRGWRVAFAFWATAFGLMLAYELFRFVQALVR
jgi:hypothetical protein